MSNLFDLKKVQRENNCWNDFKFEVVYSSQDVARIYINNRKTKYVANGYGYDKESSVISSMINDLIGKQKYNKSIYGSSCANGLASKTLGTLSGGTGFSSIQEAYNFKQGCKLTKLYSGKDSNVYEIFINPKLLTK